MVRRSRSSTLKSLEGRLGGIRQEVMNALRDLKREIAKKEEELAAMRAEYAKGEAMLRGQVSAPPAPSPRRARRSRQIDWKEVFGSLPAHFTIKTLARHPIAGRRPKPHLYAILSRWKKAGMLAKDSGDGYRKATPKPARAKRRPAKPAPQAARSRKPATPTKSAVQSEGQTT